MAQVPRSVIDQYTEALNKLSADAQAKIRAALEKVDMSDVAAARDAIIDIMELYLGPYTDMAAVLAAEFYDSLREASLGERSDAVADSRRKPAATAGAVRALMQDIVDDKPKEMFVRKILYRADAEMKRAANECVAFNADRDKRKVKYARVPAGAETCRFCIMLASRGAVYKNSELASHAHANCDCKVVPDFGDGIQGYDPNVYDDQYRKMLEGHELNPHYDLLTRNGRTTKRLYKTASHDYEAALGVKKGTGGKSFKYTASDGSLEFNSFADVKKYLYASTSKQDLQHRYSQLGNIYGFKSEQMQSTAMKNAVRHMEKRL